MTLPKGQTYESEARPHHGQACGVRGRKPPMEPTDVRDLFVTVGWVGRGRAMRAVKRVHIFEKGPGAQV